MKNTLPQRFALVGLPGSGKSTFGLKLSRLLKIPVHHLDRHMFESGGKKRDKQEFLAIQQALVDENAWIIEGCSFSTFEMRYARADTFIYFRLPRLLCIGRLLKRIFNYREEFGGLRKVNWEIVKYTWQFDREKRARIEELKRKYPHVDYCIFNSQRDADNYLKNLRDMMKDNRRGY
ncbi:MAG TPA: hypothetical protein VIJ46_05930 [Rhabdochlamydiaceae bacterium]